jgi:hypothetical protein
MNTYYYVYILGFIEIIVKFVIYKMQIYILYIKYNTNIKLVILKSFDQYSSTFLSYILLCLL